FSHSPQRIVERHAPEVVVGLSEFRGQDDRAAIGPAEVVNARRKAAQFLGLLLTVGCQLPQVGVRTVTPRLLTSLVRMRGVNDPLPICREPETEVTGDRRQWGHVSGVEIAPGELERLADAERSEQALAVA